MIVCVLVSHACVCRVCVCLHMRYSAYAMSLVLRTFSLSVPHKQLPGGTLFKKEASFSGNAIATCGCFEICITSTDHHDFEKLHHRPSRLVGILRYVRLSQTLTTCGYFEMCTIITDPHGLYLCNEVLFSLLFGFLQKQNVA